MDLDYWKEKNDGLFSKAADILADMVVGEFVWLECYKNATDLADCDGEDIQLFEFLTSHDSAFPEDTDRPYSIKEYNKTHAGYGPVFPIFEAFVEENWQDLDDELVEAVRDRVDVGKVVDKNCLGGGGFEVISSLCRATKDKVAEKIKNQIKK